MTACSSDGDGVLGREQIRRGRWRWEREVAGDGAGEGDDGADEGGDVHVWRGEFVPRSRTSGEREGIGAWGGKVGTSGEGTARVPVTLGDTGAMGAAGPVGWWVGCPVGPNGRRGGGRPGVFFLSFFFVSFLFQLMFLFSF